MDANPDPTRIPSRHLFITIFLATSALYTRIFINMGSQPEVSATVNSRERDTEFNVLVTGFAVKSLPTVV